MQFPSSLQVVRAYWWSVALTWHGVEGHLHDVADPGVVGLL